MKPQAADTGKVLRQVAVYLGLGLTVPAAGLVGYAIGFLLDRHFGTSHIFTVVFLFLGSIAGLIEILRTIAREP